MIKIPVGNPTFLVGIISTSTGKEFGSVGIGSWLARFLFTKAKKLFRCPVRGLRIWFSIEYLIFVTWAAKTTTREQIAAPVPLCRRLRPGWKLNNWKLVVLANWKRRLASKKRTLDGTFGLPERSLPTIGSGLARFLLLCLWFSFGNYEQFFFHTNWVCTIAFRAGLPSVVTLMIIPIQMVVSKWLYFRFDSESLSFCRS